MIYQVIVILSTHTYLFKKIIYFQVLSTESINDVKRPVGDHDLFGNIDDIDFDEVDCKYDKKYVLCHYIVNFDNY